MIGLTYLFLWGGLLLLGAAAITAVVAGVAWLKTGVPEYYYIEPADCAWLRSSWVKIDEFVVSACSQNVGYGYLSFGIVSLIVAYILAFNGGNLRDFTDREWKARVGAEPHKPL